MKPGIISGFTRRALGGPVSSHLRAGVLASFSAENPYHHLTSGFSPGWMGGILSGRDPAATAPVGWRLTFRISVGQVTSTQSKGEVFGNGYACSLEPGSRRHRQWNGEITAAPHSRVYLEAKFQRRRESASLDANTSVYSFM